MKHKLLLVEDDPEITQSYLYLLQDEYAITAVSSGTKAVGLVKAEADIDLIVLDYRLEDITGIEALREIRAINNIVPVLFITGFGTEDVAVKAFQNGVDDYIKKPFGYYELRDKVISLISNGDDKARNNRLRNNTEETVILERAKSVCNAGNYYKIQRALKFIDDNFMRKIGRDEAAKEACIEPTYFSKIFKDVTGRGFRAYLNDCRISRATEILSNGSRLSITELAFAVGFGDITTFERVFKKTVGVTPMQFRNSISPSLKATIDAGAV